MIAFLLRFLRRHRDREDVGLQVGVLKYIRARRGMFALLLFCLGLSVWTHNWQAVVAWIAVLVSDVTSLQYEKNAETAIQNTTQLLQLVAANQLQTRNAIGVWRDEFGRKLTITPIGSVIIEHTVTHVQ